MTSTRQNRVPKPTLSAAEFRTVRESLNLSITEAAAQCGVSIRTVRYWEAGRQHVPRHAAQKLIEIEQAAERAAEQIVQRAGKAGEEVTLLRHQHPPSDWSYPLSAHHAALDRARRAFLSRGCSVSIRYK